MEPILLADPTTNHDNGNRAVILVHGMGQTSKHSMLLSLADAVANWMDRYRLPPVESAIPETFTKKAVRGLRNLIKNRFGGPYGPDAVASSFGSNQPKMDVQLEGPGLPSISLEFNNQHWKFIEVWWADSFDAPLFDPMIGWTVQRFVIHLITLAGALLKNSILPLVILTLGLTLTYTLGLISGVAVLAIQVLLWVLKLIFWSQRDGGIGRGLANLNSWVRRWAQWSYFLVEVREFGPLKRIMRISDEYLLLDKGERNSMRYTLGEWILIVVVAFNALNALIIIPLYFAGVVLIIPVLFAIWILSMLGGIPRIAQLVRFLKSRLDSFIIGSLGDIKVFLDEPSQASKIRGELEHAIDIIDADPGFINPKIYVVAHSTGSAIAYETLALDSNAQRSKKITGLITAGSILLMVWQMGSRRSSFDAPIASNIQWQNYWARYDPALAGPIDFGKNLTNINATNEWDPFNDHSGYWANDHQVIPNVVSTIWGDDAPKHFRLSEQDRRRRLLNRKFRVMILSSFRMLAWLVFPATFTWAWLRSTELGLENVRRIDVVGWHWMSNNVWEPIWNWIAGYDVVQSSISSSPYGFWERGIAAFFMAAGVTFLAHIVYKFTRAILWDGFLQDLFRA